MVPGCFAVQQTDITPKVNTPGNIATADPLNEVLAQVAQNQKDLPAAIQANQNAGSTQAQQNLAAVEALVGTPVSKAVPVQTPLTPGGGPAGGAVVAAPAATTGAASTGRGKGKNNGNGTGSGGNGNGNGAGNGNANRNGNGNRNVRRSAVGPDRPFVVVDFDDDE